MINSDNYYPLESLRQLRQLDSPGAAVFERQSMFAGSNIEPERLAAFAIVQFDQHGYLQQIIEKPDPQTLDSLPDPLYICMNCWRFGPEIFQACRKSQQQTC